jgi:hypothetical protein
LIYTVITDARYIPEPGIVRVRYSQSQLHPEPGKARARYSLSQVKLKPGIDRARYSRGPGIARYSQSQVEKGAD